MKRLFLLCIPLYAYAGSTSIVYNFRIAEITKEPITSEGDNNKNMIVVLAFDQYNKKYSNASFHYSGGLLAYIYAINPYFIRADTAFAHIYSKDPYGQRVFSGTQSDDILITLGRNFSLESKGNINGSLLFGIPTHPLYILQHPEFGFGQFGIGAQIDGSVPIPLDNTFLYGARYIRFLKSNPKDCAGNTYTYSNGNVQDFLLAFNKDWKPHAVEAGYTARFQYGSSICPSFDDIITQTEYMRSSLYAVYKYNFRIKRTINRFLANFAYSRDHRPKYYGNRYVVQGWVSWNINF